MTRTRINVKGVLFGRLTPISEKSPRMWLCNCSCGNERLVKEDNLISGNSKSCGCSRKTWLNITEKVCAKCHVLFPLSQFHVFVDKRVKNQKPRPQSYCKRCSSQASSVTQKKYRPERMKRIADIKMESGCVDCGYKKHPAALDFDHVRGEKKFGISYAIFRPWKSVLEEIEKCEVVCANCHRIRSITRGNKKLKTRKYDYVL